MATAIALGKQSAEVYPTGRLLFHAPPDFETPIKPISALVAATVLWLSFTLLELVEVVEDNERPSGLGYIPVDEGETRHEHRETRDSAGSGSGVELTTGKTEDLYLFFCRTEVEFGIGLALLVEWTVYWKQALFVLFFPIPLSSKELVLLTGSYIVIVAGLTALALQLLVSLGLHLLRNGCNVIGEDVWGARTGQWAFRGMIKLEEEDTTW
ncbi:hypothetical protein JCM24511_10204 [Saitozyma sp. JCM 24511]|nr:hypothetical protein JCM24511_10204 [Saitozyma sp. JCM 24511]